MTTCATAPRRCSPPRSRDGRVEQTCLPRHRHQEFLRFLKQVAKAYPRTKLHIVCDNYATQAPRHHHLADPQPSDHLHFTPTSGSWLNMVEIFFGIITAKSSDEAASDRSATDRGNHHVHRRLNERCQPFTWTKDADTIITKAHRQSTSGTRH